MVRRVRRVRTVQRARGRCCYSRTSGGTSSSTRRWSRSWRQREVRARALEGPRATSPLRGLGCRCERAALCGAKLLRVTRACPGRARSDARRGAVRRAPPGVPLVEHRALLRAAPAASDRVQAEVVIPRSGRGRAGFRPLSWRAKRFAHSHTW
eukprot:132683-Prymnesium_polylepis.1